jgi:transglutaminase-like putative cysteine protease
VSAGTVSADAAAGKANPLGVRRNLTLLQAQQWAGSLTALFAFLSCAASGELTLPLVAIYPLALVGAVMFGERAYGKLEWLWTTFLAGSLLVFAGLVLTRRVDIVLAAARFAELLCIHRLWHRRTQRDEMLLLLLSLLLLCAGAALSAELLFGFAFLGFSVTATWAMALTHLRFEIEAGRGTQGSAALLQSRRVATPQLLGALAALSMLGLVGAAVVFVTFPRVTIRGLRRASHKQPLAGLSNRVDLSLQGAIGDDPRVVLRVRLDPDPGSEHLAMHWRARALSVWTGQGWRAADGAQMPAQRMAQRPKQRPGPRRRSPLTADIEAVSGYSDGVVLTPEGWPFGVEFKRPLSASGPAQRLYRDAAGDLFYQPIDVGDTRYLVTVTLDDPGLAPLRGRGQQYPAWLAPDLAVPADLSPRIAALAKRIAGDKDPADAAAALEHWLSSNLEYTRDLAGEVADPISNFLFKRRKGHCELFSSTMVIMLRSLGIPARNVTGYFGGERTSAGYYAIRGGDAHSWVEVYFPGAGFMRFDPTPALERGNQQSGIWAKAVLAWDALQQRWRAFVVDYDLVSQGQALRRMGQLFSEASARLSGRGGPATRVRTLFIGIGGFLVAALFALWLRRLRFRRPSLWRTSTLDKDQRRALRLWRAARRRMRRAGLEVPRSATAREVAHSVKVAAASELAAVYTAARWGGAALSAADSRRLLRNLAAGLSSRE